MPTIEDRDAPSSSGRRYYFPLIRSEYHTPCPLLVFCERIGMPQREEYLTEASREE